MQHCTTNESEADNIWPINGTILKISYFGSYLSWFHSKKTIWMDKIPNLSTTLWLIQIWGEVMHFWFEKDRNCSGLELEKDKIHFWVKNQNSFLVDCHSFWLDYLSYTNYYTIIIFSAGVNKYSNMAPAVTDTKTIYCLSRYFCQYRYRLLY